MIDVIQIFLLIGSIIVIGFLGSLFFKRTKISDIIILLLIGLLVGPVFYLVPATTIEFLKGVTPLFASLALMMLLFDGGLQMNLYKVLRELSKVTAFTLLVFFLSIIIISIILLSLGWPLMYSLLLGAIVGGVSSAVVIPLIKKTAAKEETKRLLSLESAITDALCVIVALAVIQIILSANLDWQEIAQNIFGAFSIAAVAGLVVGVAWLKLLREYESIKKYQYLLTIAVLFLVFAGVEFARGNGAIAALVFGLILGNSREIMRIFRMKEIKLDTNIRLFQSEISFFIKTFFFVYLGLVFDLAALNSFTILIAVALMVAILLARAIATKLMIWRDKTYAEDPFFLTSMMSRGLAAAVLATYPITMGLGLNVYTQQIVQIAFLIILFSNIATTGGIYLAGRGKSKQKTIDSEKLQEMKLEPQLSTKGSKTT